jgi:hypothetical protein
MNSEQWTVICDRFICVFRFRAGSHEGDRLPLAFVESQGVHHLLRQPVTPDKEDTLPASYNGLPKMYFSGEMEEAAIWSRGLSDAEVSTLLRVSAKKERLSGGTPLPIHRTL